MSNPIPSEAGCYLDEFDAERFWSLVNFHGGTDHESDRLATAEGECWLWTGGLTEAGYGRFKIFGTVRAAHRVAFKDFGGKMPDEASGDHLCRNHACVRPSHVEAVTHAVNMSRGVMANKTHCKNNHEFTEANTNRVTKDGKTVRHCRACRKAWGAAAYQRRKSAA
jgi:hypothetical protein